MHKKCPLCVRDRREHRILLFVFFFFVVVRDEKKSPNPIGVLGLCATEGSTELSGERSELRLWLVL